jgi:hypothetical protein
VKLEPSTRVLEPETRSPYLRRIEGPADSLPEGESAHSAIEQSTRDPGAPSDQEALAEVVSEIARGSLL